MALLDLIRDPESGIAAIEAYLDAIPPASKKDEVIHLDRDAQRRLYVKASASSPIGLEHFVPEGRPPLDPVRHSGKNTLPLPGRHRWFSKVFCRPADGTARLFGYNDAPSRRVVGPGYFVGMPTVGHPRWYARGGLVVDYFQVPEGTTPRAWPRVKRNRQGLQRFVYDGTRDYMRRVSGDVSIGAAYKGDRPLDHYFVLLRQP